jgi:hypothetical protein
MLHLFVPVNVLIPQVPFCYTSGYEYRTAISVDYTPPCDMGFKLMRTKTKIKTVDSLSRKEKKKNKQLHNKKLRQQKQSTRNSVG